MRKYWNTVQDEKGNPREGVSVAVQQSGSNVTIYADEDGNNQKTNPLTTDARGYFEFFAGQGDYDLVVSGTGFDSYTIENAVQIGDSSSDVTFLQSGTGAAARTAQAKMRDIFSVKDFGAVGDGTTDDRVAIQAAIDAASTAGVGLYVPGGTYRLTKGAAQTDEAGTIYPCLTMRSNLHIFAERGATFKLADSQSTDSAPLNLGIFFSNDVLSNLSFRNLTLDMNGANNTISPSRPGSYNLYNMAHISFSGTPGGVAAKADDVLIDGCSFINGPGASCVVMTQSNTASVTIGKRWTIRNCLFNNNGLDTSDHSCIFGWADDVICDGNTFTADTMQGTTGSTGMLVAYEVHGANHRFVNNKVKNAYRGLWVSANNTSDVTNTQIDNNTFSPVKAYAVDFSRESAGASAIYKTTISNNHIGISNDSGGPSPRAGINIAASYQVRDIRICDNNAESVDTSVGAAFVQITPQAVSGQTHTGVVIEDNQTIGFTMGVLIATNSTNGLGSLRIANNNWRDHVAGDTFTTPLGIDGSRIDAAGAVVNLELIGNTAVDTRGGSAVMQYGIYLSGLITNLYEAANNADGMTVSAYTESSLTVTNRKGLITTGTYATTFTFNGSGGTSGSVTVSYQMIGKFLQLNIPVFTATSGTGSISATSDTLMPAAIRPTASQRVVCAAIVNNGAAVATPGLVRITSGGGIILYRDDVPTAWTNSTTCGLDSEGLSLIIFVG